MLLGCSIGPVTRIGVVAAYPECVRPSSIIPSHRLSPLTALGGGEASRPKLPLAVHCLSNGGFFMLAWLLQSAGFASRFDVQSVVVDSAPTITVEPHILARGIVAASMPRSAPARDYTIRGVTPALTALAKMQRFLSQGHRAQALADAETMVQHPAPQLALFSPQDMLVTQEYVRDYCRLRRKAGRSIQEAPLPTHTPHVGGFRAHPKEYAAHLETFYSALE